ncbi:MAG: phospho-sugar mutase [Clostridia bacterium]|nr:phospho-sugar mutase [Clostridia bacterium]
MSNYSAEYKKWLSYGGLEKELFSELEAISGNEKEIKERFSEPLSFGTAGLRGIIRAGINGMNIYTVAQATQGIAALVNKSGGKKSAVIASDTRIKSDLFSEISARVLAANGIKTYIFDAPRPTPELSFAVRYLGAKAGINITASHNPKEYNGYKAYWEDGVQISPEQAKTVSDEMEKIDIFEGAKVISFDEGVKRGLIEVVGKEIDEAYLEKVLEERIHKDAVPDVADTFKVVYTPFHGAGAKLVPEALKRAGLKNLYTVDEQMIPDGSFPTVKSPNPEEKEGFYLAIELAKKNGCGLIIGTDPDSDRVGVVVKSSDGRYVTLTGNQIGVMLLSYIIEARKLNNKLPQNAAAVKSIVSTRLADAICEKNGVKLVNVLTGFKYIGEKIKEFEETGEYTYIFGFEESHGCLSGTYARDKDAVCASMLVAEMAAYYSKKGQNLYDVLQNLFKEYGYYKEITGNIVLPGLDGIEKMFSMIENLRNNPPEQIAGEKVVKTADYKTGKIRSCDGKEEETGLPKTNMLIFTLSDGCDVIIRPSGTEPKIKLYCLAKGNTEKEAEDKANNCSEYMKKLLGI